MPTPLYEGSIDEGATAFFIAAQQGQVELLDPLFDAGVEVNELVRVRLHVGHLFGGPGPGMAAAAGAGMVNVMDGEVIHGNAPMYQTIEATALYIAVQNGHLAAVRKLMELGADPKIAASNRLTPFYLAMDLAKMEIVNEFLALEDADDLRLIVNLEGPMGTPLSIAGLRMGDFDLMNALLLKGANVNALIGGQSLFSLALSQDKFDLVAFLLARDDIDVKVDKEFYALLPLALKKRKFDIAAALVAKGADVNQKHVTTLFFMAAKNADFDVLRFLAGFERTDLNPEFAGATPIFMAAGHGRLDVAEVLLGFERTDFNRECNGVTPIYIAAQNGHLEAVRALIAAGAHLGSSITRPSPLMATPLSAAVRKGYPEIASLLADHLKILLEGKVAEMSARAGAGAAAAAGPGLFAEPPELKAAKALLRVYKAEAGEDTVKEHAAVLKRSVELKSFFSDLKPYLRVKAGGVVAGAAASHGAGGH